MKIHDRYRSRQDEFSSGRSGRTRRGGGAQVFLANAATALHPRIAGIAIDLGDKWSHYCSIDEKGDIAAEGRLQMTRQHSQTCWRDLSDMDCD
jgi:hypothetical protein